MVVVVEVEVEVVVVVVVVVERKDSGGWMKKTNGRVQTTQSSL